MLRKQAVFQIGNSKGGRQPSGAALTWGLILGGSLIAVGLLVFLMRWNAQNAYGTPVESADRSEPLVVLCGAALREPMEAVAEAYRKETGTLVRAQYGKSEEMLSIAEVSRRGDLYLPGDDSYLSMGRQKRLVAEILPIASQCPVLAVKKGNPKRIGATADLAREDVAVVLASPGAAIGKLAREVLAKSGDWAALERKKAAGGGKVAELGTVTEVANALKVGAADAGIVWDTTLEQYPELEAVRVPALDAAERQVAVGVLTVGVRPTEALRFARFLAARDRGLPEFRKRAFRVVEGDEWAARPELTLFSGSMLRPAIEETLKAFQAREDCRIATVYNGCGILVGQMKTGARPDAYFSCDASFMKQVQVLFKKADNIAANAMVIAVAKGNPKGIHALPDLARPGLKLGIGHEEQCALGFLTKEVLDQLKGCKEILKNVAVRSPTGDFLVNQMRAGALDAVIVYQSNVTFSKNELDVVKVDLPQQFATQPIAVGKDSKYTFLSGRLLDAIRSEESRARFQSNGFEWLGSKK